jgi:signal transduction histidine kinase
MADFNEDTRSRKELTEALDFRDRVLGILGHDLRNPLSAISALTTVTMDREDLPAGVRERLVQVDRAARRSLAMIETLLDFSESRFTGALSTRLVMADPAEIALRAVEELHAAHPGRLIAVDIKSRGLFPLDPGRMQQVLGNLIGNALVHGWQDQPVELSIEVRESEALLTVRNRGPVIPGDQVTRLFEPFIQGVSRGASRGLASPGGAGLADRPRGLGLGLYIVRQIVAAHGGTVTVESSVERGTTFFVRLPRERPV